MEQQHLPHYRRLPMEEIIWCCRTCPTRSSMSQADKPINKITMTSIISWNPSRSQETCLTLR